MLPSFKLNKSSVESTGKFNRAITGGSKTLPADAHKKWTSPFGVE
jgi:hypothetical protein